MLSAHGSVLHAAAVQPCSRPRSAGFGQQQQAIMPHRRACVLPAPTQLQMQQPMRYVCIPACLLCLLLDSASARS